MFALRDADLHLRILGCADGPASFNAEATQKDCFVVSCDPLYRFDADEILTRIHATFDKVIDQPQRNQSQFLWDAIPSIEDLGDDACASEVAGWVKRSGKRQPVDPVNRMRRTFQREVT
ncbi:MAG: hypothetical protein KY476_03630 [Planctomycetes bacterium]|nr:hypothetical protein [Planctomycetota bacterium]